MNFQEAEAQFRWLEGQRAAGNLNEQAYRDGLNQLRVTDAGGRLWMMQERTGQWHVHDGKQWIAATPPVQAPPPPLPPPPPPSPAASRPAAPPTAASRQPAPAPAQSEGCSCAKFALFFVIWLVTWVVIAVVVYFIAKEEPMVLLGVAAAALISLVLMLFSLAGHWKGQIVDLKTERVKVPSGDDDWDWEDQTFAYIRQPNGRIRKMRAMGGWQVGDWLEKRRGEGHIRVIQGK
jgi:hypothetical protein